MITCGPPPALFRTCSPQRRQPVQLVRILLVAEFATVRHVHAGHPQRAALSADVARLGELGQLGRDRLEPDPGDDGHPVPTAVTDVQRVVPGICSGRYGNPASRSSSPAPPRHRARRSSATPATAAAGHRSNSHSRSRCASDLPEPCIGSPAAGWIPSSTSTGATLCAGSRSAPPSLLSRDLPQLRLRLRCGRRHRVRLTGRRSVAGHEPAKKSSACGQNPSTGRYHGTWPAAGCSVKVRCCSSSHAGPLNASA